MELISIIVPVYNAETGIERCVNSILAQTYSNIEIILVDDGSTDDSADILEGFARKCKHVRVIHTENRGVSAARNAGIGMAKGDYIGFTDADDWIDPDMYRHMLDLIKRENADISVCGYYEEGAVKDAPSSDSNLPGSIALSPCEAYGMALKDEGFNGFVFNKLFRSIFFSQQGYNMRMDESLHICEDLLFVCQSISKASKVIYDPAPLYHYTVSSFSSSHGPFSARMATLPDARRKISDLAKKNFPSLVRLAENQYITDIIYICILALHDRSGWTPSKADIKSLRRNAVPYVTGKGNAFKYKLLAVALSISPLAVKTLWRLFRGGGKEPSEI